MEGRNCLGCNNGHRCLVEESELDLDSPTREISKSEIAKAVLGLCPECPCVECDDDAKESTPFTVNQNETTGKYCMISMRFGQMACGKSYIFSDEECANFSPRRQLSWSDFGDDYSY